MAIHPGNDHRPAERCVGFGIVYADGDLAVPCGRCKAPVGEECSKRGGGTHTARQDRATNYFRGKAMKLFMELENAALAIDPDGPLWSFQGIPHQCGTLGAHVLTECRPTP